MTHVPKAEDTAGRYSSTSQPRVIAGMLEAFQLTAGMRVLEIGAGTGYNATLITAITGVEVVTIDVCDVIVTEATQATARAGEKNVTALVPDGYLGCAGRGPVRPDRRHLRRHRSLTVLARPAHRRRPDRRPGRPRWFPPHPRCHP
nr:hypothetical protein [Streptomyces gobiensis]